MKISNDQEGTRDILSGIPEAESDMVETIPQQSGSGWFASTLRTFRRKSLDCSLILDWRVGIPVYGKGVLVTWEEVGKCDVSWC
jgi:hypothetical protein